MRPGLPDHRYPGGRPRRLLDPSGAPVRRDRKPRGRRRVDPDFAPRSAGKDRPDRWRDPGAHSDGFQAWRTAGVFNGQGADATGGGPPACLSRAPDTGGRAGREDWRTGDGRPLPVHLKAQIIRELDRLEVVLEQLKTVEAERDALLKPANDEMPSPAAMLAQLKGIGSETAVLLWSEGLFRRFDNRRQVAAYAGLAPTPWQSGSIDHEQGVSKAGNPRLRATMVELAWLWLQNPPPSTLSLWFHERGQGLGGRMRKSIIVALARKLLIALWRYTTAGIVIEGAMMKPSPATT